MVEPPSALYVKESMLAPDRKILHNDLIEKALGCEFVLCIFFWRIVPFFEIQVKLFAFLFIPQNLEIVYQVLR